VRWLLSFLHVPPRRGPLQLELLQPECGARVLFYVERDLEEGRNYEQDDGQECASEHQHESDWPGNALFTEDEQEYTHESGDHPEEPHDAEKESQLSVTPLHARDPAGRSSLGEDASALRAFIFGWIVHDGSTLGALDRCAEKVH